MCQAVYPASLPWVSKVSIGARLGSPKVFCPAGSPKFAVLSIVYCAHGEADVARIWPQPGARAVQESGALAAKHRAAAAKWQAIHHTPVSFPGAVPASGCGPGRVGRALHREDGAAHIFRTSRIRTSEPRRVIAEQHWDVAPQPVDEKVTLCLPRCEPGISDSRRPVSPWPAPFSALCRQRDLHHNSANKSPPFHGRA